MRVEKHFVTFYWPGSFFAESATVEIGSWSLDAAVEMVRAKHSKSVPYGFRFTTRAREDSELDSSVVATSPMYFLGGKVETLQDVEARGLDSESILLSNMRCNGYGRIITNNNTWRWTQPLEENDVVLDWPVQEVAA